MGSTTVCLGPGSWCVSSLLIFLVVLRGYITFCTDILLSHGLLLEGDVNSHSTFMYIPRPVSTCYIAVFNCTFLFVSVY